MFDVNQINNLTQQLKTQSQQQNPISGLPPEDMLVEHQKIATALDQTSQAVEEMKTLNNREQQIVQQKITMLKNQPIKQAPMAPIKAFNLRTVKAQQMPTETITQEPVLNEFQTPQPTDLMTDQTMNYPQNEDGEKFKDGADLKQRFLDVGDPQDMENQRNIRNFVLEHTSDDQQDEVNKLLDLYFDPTTDGNDQTIFSAQIFDRLVDAVKIPGEDSGETIMAPITKVEMNKLICNLVKESNEQIKSLAKKASQQEDKNPLKKLAQHKTQENVIMWGPAQTRVDPFTRQPISDWHIVERNKGFGLVVDDIWNIDFEAIWRGNIMDKYTREYRDKDGNWVGGYINKRFEVDKWIPEANNYQLKPGQRRRPYLPQYASTEARLEDMRSKKDRGAEPNSTGSTFDWNTASSKNESKAFNLKQAKSEDKKKSLAQFDNRFKDQSIDVHGIVHRLLLTLDPEDKQTLNGFFEEGDWDSVQRFLEEDPRARAIYEEIIEYAVNRDPEAIQSIVIKELRNVLKQNLEEDSSDGFQNVSREGFQLPTEPEISPKKTRFEEEMEPGFERLNQSTEEIKTAELKPLKPLKLPGEKEINSKFYCAECGARTKDAFGPCPGCQKVNTGKRGGMQYNKPEDPGKQFNPYSNDIPMYVMNKMPVAATEEKFNLSKLAKRKKNHLPRLNPNFSSKEFKPAIAPNGLSNDQAKDDGEYVSPEEASRVADELCMDD